MLNSKQRSYLRGMANTLNPIFQFGKNGLGDTFVNQISEALEVRELIKITILKNADVDNRELCEELATQTQSQVVQLIGSKITLYKESKENKKIYLPK